MQHLECKGGSELTRNSRIGSLGTMNIEASRSSGMPIDGRSSADRIEVAFRNVPEHHQHHVVSSNRGSAVDKDKRRHSLKLELRSEEKMSFSPNDSNTSLSHSDLKTDHRVNVVEIPAEGTNEEHVKRRRKSATGGETDFYRKPTMLSRLILNQKYGNAIRRVFNHPEEAKVWVCAKRARKQRSNIPQHGTDERPHETAAIYTIRQLPVHIACSSLSRTHDTHMQRLLNELISVLIFAFPDGAHEADHRARFPIHDAIWYGAAPDTIALFLMAKPEAIHVTDSQGRSLAELNRYRNGSCKEAIQHLLNQEIDFWIHARAEATTRLQHNNIRFPSENNTISSVSVLASNTAEDDTIMTSFSHQPPVEPDEISPLSWDQLEKRLIASEQILTTINERNFELTKQVEALTLIDQAKGAELVRELARMSEESALLNAKLHSIENLCAQCFLTGDQVRDQPYQQALSEMSSLMGLSDQSQRSEGTDQPVLQVTKEAMAMHKALSSVQTRQRERIRKMRHIVEDLIVERSKADEDDKDDNDDESLGESAISALTSHSARSHLVKTMPRRGSIDPVMVDRTPPSSTRQQMDDLDAILRFAAAKDKARLCAGTDRRASRMPQTDDLDAILHWATNRDETRLKDAQRRPSVTSNWSPDYAEHSPTKAANASRQHVTPPRSNCTSIEGDLALPALMPSTEQGSSDRVDQFGTQRSGLEWHGPDRSDVATNDAPDETAARQALTHHVDTISTPRVESTSFEKADHSKSWPTSKDIPSSSPDKQLEATFSPLRKETESTLSGETKTTKIADQERKEVPQEPEAIDQPSVTRNLYVI